MASEQEKAHAEAIFVRRRVIRATLAHQNRTSQTAMANFNNQAKRKRELAKQDKRAAKDRKRAQRKAAARGEGAPVAARAATPNAPTTAPSLSKAAAEWMKPVRKTPAVKGRPTMVSATTFIRRLNIGGK